MCQGILEQPNDPAGQQTRDLAATRHRKKMVTRSGKSNTEKNECAGAAMPEKQSNERNSNRHRNAEPIYLSLLARCASDGHAIGEEFRSVGLP